MDNQFSEADFEFIKKEKITENVVKSLTLSTPGRTDLINKMVPFFLKDLAHNFAGTKGSPTYNRFESRYFEYVYYILRKK